MISFDARFAVLGQRLCTYKVGNVFIDIFISTITLLLLMTFLGLRLWVIFFNNFFRSASLFRATSCYGFGFRLESWWKDSFFDNLLNRIWLWWLFLLQLFLFLNFFLFFINHNSSIFCNFISTRPSSIVQQCWLL